MALGNMHVSRERLSVQVADQVKELIRSRQLKPHDRLPAERELAEQLGISRTILREAMKLLEQQGLISVQVGRGTFVSAIDPQEISDTFAESLNIMMQQISQTRNFEHFFEVRMVIEIENARLAALRATDEDIHLLEKHLADMVLYHESDIARFAQADTSYHQALAQATQNPLFVTLLLSITKLLLQIQREASVTTGGPGAALAYHQRILNAVRERNPNDSQQAMREHLEDVYTRLLPSIKD